MYNDMDDDTPARSLADLRLAAIVDDPTVKVIVEGDRLSFIEAELLYVDLSADAAAVENAQNVLQNAGGQILSCAECCRRLRSDDETAASSTLEHFRYDLRIEIWDLSAARAQDADFDILRLIAGLQTDDPEAASPVRPMTVYTKAPWSGGPFGSPMAAKAPTDLPAPPSGYPTPGTIRFAVLDTGIPDGYATMHPHLQYTVDASDSNSDSPIYETPSTDLLMDAGHGLFIWDIAYRQAAQLAPAYLPRVTRDDTGVTLSELDIVGQLSTLVHNVVTDGGGQLLVNMSFSGTTEDSSPLGLGAELQLLHDSGLDVLVVAAAGNDSSGDPHWPAAFATTLDNVVSVGALASGTTTVASFSNRGAWVDCWTEGTSVDAAYLPGVGDDPANPEVFPLVAGEEAWATWQGTSFAAPRVAAAIANQATSSPGHTLLHAWATLQSDNAGNHPTWVDASSTVITETGVIVAE